MSLPQLLDTYAEAFDMRCTRLIVTAEDVIYRHSGYRPGDEKELAAFVESMFKTKADGE